MGLPKCNLEPRSLAPDHIVLPRMIRHPRVRRDRQSLKRDGSAAIALCRAPKALRSVEAALDAVAIFVGKLLVRTINIAAAV